MKVFTIIMIFLSSCAQKTLFTEINDERKDVLAHESLIRYSKGRILNLEKSLYVKSISQCYSGDVKEGLKDLMQFYNPENESAEYWNALASCYYYKGDIIKSKFYYGLSLNSKKSTQLTKATALNNLGVIYLSNSQWAKANLHFKKAINTAKHLKTPVFNLAQLQLEFGHYQSSINYLNSLLSSAPEDIDVLAAIGTAYVLDNKPKEALTYFTKIDSEFVKRADIATYYAFALYKDGQYQFSNEVLSNKENSNNSDINTMAKQLNELVAKKLKELEK
ncbi:MAG: hypothetical protein H6622_11975 [Halobacteriovoraceae bacterium]|nr:hypothetical protein [Halobacteriovoraceae bacterium]